MLQCSNYSILLSAVMLLLLVPSLKGESIIDDQFSTSAIMQMTASSHVTLSSHLVTATLKSPTPSLNSDGTSPLSATETVLLSSTITSSIPTLATVSLTDNSILISPTHATSVSLDQLQTQLYIPVSVVITTTPLSTVPTQPPSLIPPVSETAAPLPSSIHSTPSLKATVFTAELPSSATTQPMGTETTKENENSMVTSGVPPAAIIGIVVGGVITVVSLSLSIFLLICFCCCCVLNRKYEYSTGNENRMTVQHWHITAPNFMHRADSVSSIGSSRSRSSSIFSSFGFGRRYSNNNSADHVSSIFNQSIPDLYSTPL